MNRFYDIYGADSISLGVNLSQLVSPSITQVDNINLINIPGDEEIREVVFHIGAFKAPGPDGMPSLFYKTYWKTVGLDIVRLVQDFFISNRLHPAINATNLVLILKVPKPTKLNHYCPIYVCNIVYKFIAKILANQIKLLLPLLICPCQNAFVPGRSIHDNLVMVQEVIHSMRKKRGRGGWMALKIDLEKAYDRMNWSFIWYAIHEFAFLIEKLDKKLSGWKAKLLSKASRLVLIKSVAQAIPNYVMQSTAIPKSVCEKLDSRMRRFWWGARDTLARPLCLHSWDKICTPKLVGGLGLRRSYDMNCALLAKWSWDLISGNSSLCFSMLRGKYLRDKAFISVSVFPLHSLFWKAILAMKSLLLRGAYIQVETGSMVDFWLHPWVPKHPLFRPQPICDRGPGTLVFSDLLSPDGSWNLQKLHAVFSQADCVFIQSMHRPRLTRVDRWIWTPSSSGKFSTESAYLLD
ncbi:hypothetical protein UlMin_024304 [Ulmus minor]